MRDHGRGWPRGGWPAGGRRCGARCRRRRRSASSAARMWPFCPASVAASAAQRAGRQAEVEADAETWRARMPAPVRMSSLCSASAPAQLVDERQDRVAAAVHDRAAADLDDVQPRQQRGSAGRSATGRTRSRVEQGLARERRGDVLRDAGVGGGSVIGVVSSVGRDDRADVLAGEGAGDVAGLEAVDDLHRPDVPGRRMRSSTGRSTTSPAGPSGHAARRR